MISVDDRERIRRAHFDEKWSRRRIEREMGHDRRTINKALASAEEEPYKRKVPRRAPVLGSWQARLDALIAESESLPRKQRLTAQRIFEIVQREGFAGSLPSIERYVYGARRQKKRPDVFLPLDWDPGDDAQADWGEAQVDLAGDRMVVQFLLMRACYSRKPFVRAYPTQKQESFLDALAQGFDFFGGVFPRVTFDNLKVAVQQVLEGKNRIQQRTFVAFRSHYLFDARFCTPGEGHEKGGVESGVGYAQRNFFSPILSARDFDDLNAQLLALCLQQDTRIVRGCSRSIGQLWQDESSRLKPLPKRRFACCVSAELTINGYGQVTFETNRYSVPAEKVRKHLTVKAYPFIINILDGEEIIASHSRSYERHQDVIDPLHYLALLEQRPGAFEHARPMRQLRANWPAVFEDVLARLQRDEGLGIREFVRVLRLLEIHPRHQLEAAMRDALTLNTVNRDAIELILRAYVAPDMSPPPLDLTAFPHLQHLQRIGQSGRQGQNNPDVDAADQVDARIYDNLLTASTSAPAASSQEPLQGDGDCHVYAS